MIETKRINEIIINNHFNSETEEEIALSMSTIIANLINRDLENMESKENTDEIKAMGYIES
ncbi:hypothetical protein [Xylanivirga thermophila]|uniref:hypothetical protein n=1 Tax=Xylanivirga thermophila TaxID=2496273 RepID=UPI00101DC68F|nr:hypothetical protein [Xylanivirga thermophila]